jgi:hypothetical protein
VEEAVIIRRREADVSVVHTRPPVAVVSARRAAVAVWEDIILQRAVAAPTSEEHVPPGAAE